MESKTRVVAQDDDCPRPRIYVIGHCLDLFETHEPAVAVILDRRRTLQVLDGGDHYHAFRYGPGEDYLGSSHVLAHGRLDQVLLGAKPQPPVGGLMLGDVRELGIA